MKVKNGFDLRLIISIATSVIIIAVSYGAFHAMTANHMENTSKHLSLQQVIDISKVEEIHKMLVQIRDIVMANEQGLAVLETRFVELLVRFEKLTDKLENQ